MFHAGSSNTISWQDCRNQVTSTSLVFSTSPIRQWKFPRENICIKLRRLKTTRQIYVPWFYFSIPSGPINFKCPWKRTCWSFITFFFSQTKNFQWKFIIKNVGFVLVEFECYLSSQNVFLIFPRSRRTAWTFSLSFIITFWSFANATETFGQETAAWWFN